MERCILEHIILEGNKIEGIVFDLSDLEAYLQELTDPRDERGKVYTLGSLLTMVIMARLSGEDKPRAIFEWVRLRKEAIVRVFDLKRNQTPCENTFRTLLGEVILVEEVEMLLQRYLLEKYGGQTSQLVCIDGKTMRGTIPKGCSRGTHLLSAYLAEEGIVLKQIAVAEKTNEISAGPELLEGLDIKNRVVCADAMQTQRTFCTEVLRGGGNYLLWVKGNQPTLEADIIQFFQPPRRTAGCHIAQLPRSEATTLNKGHGRIERRKLTLIEDKSGFLDWPGVQQVFMLERSVTEIATGRKTNETVYGLTSCSPKQGNAKQLLEWTRAY